MTLCNLLVQGEAAFLASDTALLAPDGTVSSFRAKSRAFTGIRTAIALQGSYISGEAIDALRAWGEGESQEAAMQALPALGRRLAREMEALHRRIPLPRAPALTVFVATWSEVRDQAEAYVVPILRPNVVHKAFIGRCRPVLSSLSPEPSGGIDREAFDVRRDLMSLVDDQRRSTIDYGYPIVGGELHLTTVRRDEVTAERLHRWPDEIGERIDPDRCRPGLWARTRRRAALALVELTA